MTSSTKEKRVEHIQMLLNACAQLGPIRSIDIAAFIWRNEPSALRMAQSLIADMLKERVLLMRKHGHTPFMYCPPKVLHCAKITRNLGKICFAGCASMIDAIWPMNSVFIAYKITHHLPR